MSANVQLSTYDICSEITVFALLMFKVFKKKLFKGHKFPRLYAKEHGIKSLSVEVSGPGSGRESALRSLQAIGYIITSIKDVLSLIHI